MKTDNTKTKNLLTVELRYLDSPKHSGLSTEHVTRKITIGIFDSLEEAITEGNKTIKKLSEYFEIRHEDRFDKYTYLVTNTCYPTNRIQYFAKITPLHFHNLTDAIKEAFESQKRWKEHEEL